MIEAIVLGDGGRRHQATLAALIASKSNVHLGDRQGRTPMQLARGRGFCEMVRMLVDAGAKQPPLAGCPCSMDTIKDRVVRNCASFKSW